jgi:hypothetical protein
MHLDRGRVQRERLDLDPHDLLRLQQHRCPVRQPQDGALRLTSNPVVFTLHFSIGTGDHLHSLRELARIRAFTMIELPPLVRAHGVSIQLAPTIPDLRPKRKMRRRHLTVSATHVLIVAESSPLKNVPQLPSTGEAEDIERVHLLRQRGRPDLF